MFAGVGLAWAACLAGAASSVAADSVVYDWGAFRCHSEVILERPEGIRRNLEQLRGSLAEMCGITLSDEPITLYVFSSRRRYLAHLSETLPAARRQRGVFLRRDEGMCVYSFQQQDLPTVLRHECTHALLHSALPYVPLWLDEGLASYFEVEESAQAAGHPFRSRVQWSVSLGRRPDLKVLEAKRRSEDLDLDDYRHAWVWVHFLLHHSDASRDVLTGTLANIAEGAPPRPLSDALLAAMPDSPQRLVAHVKAWRR